MTQLPDDRRPDEKRAARLSRPTRRAGDARPSEIPAADARRLVPVAELADLTEQAEAAARAALGVLAAKLAPVPLVPGSGRGRQRPRGARPPARPPALLLVAAVLGSTGLGLLVAASPTAPAEATDVAENASVSVAQELGLDGGARAELPQADATDRLGAVTASRTVREARQAAAAQEQAEADRLAAEALAEAARPDAVLPVDGGRLTSGFGARWGTLHAGIDLAAPMRTPEYAAMDGVVLEAGPASGYGLVVYLQHQNGDVTVYGHMDEVLVAPGQVVRAGDTIALLGNRGQSTGPHLHFEVRLGGLGGQPVDPVPYLQERGVRF